MSAFGGGSSNEQVLTGLESWPPDVTCRGSLYKNVWGSRARGSVWGPVDDVPELIGVFFLKYIFRLIYRTSL